MGTSGGGNSIVSRPWVRDNGVSLLFLPTPVGIFFLEIVMTLADKILDILVEKPYCGNDIAERLGINRTQAKVVLGKLHKAGKVARESVRREEGVRGPKTHFIYSIVEDTVQA